MIIIITVALLCYYQHYCCWILFTLYRETSRFCFCRVWIGRRCGGCYW